MQTFAERLKELAKTALKNDTFTLKSHYSSKREILCRRYLRTSDAVLENIAKMYPDAETFFGKSALEQRITFSLIEGMYIHFDKRYFRAEVDALLSEMFDAVGFEQDSIQKKMNHTTKSTARIIVAAAKSWGFVDGNLVKRSTPFCVEVGSFRSKP